MSCQGCARAGPDMMDLTDPGIIALEGDGVRVGEEEIHDEDEESYDEDEELYHEEEESQGEEESYNEEIYDEEEGFYGEHEDSEEDYDIEFDLYMQDIRYRWSKFIRTKKAMAKFAGMPPLPESLPVGDDYDAVYDEWEEIADFAARGAYEPGSDSRDHKPLTAAMIRGACTHPSMKLFTLLVKELGWHPNQALEDGDVALNLILQQTSHGEHAKIIEFLLDEGADPNLGRHLDIVGEGVGPTDRMSGIALNTASWSCPPRIFDLLLAKGAKLEYATPLHWVVWSHVHLVVTNGTTMIKHLVGLGVDINGGDERQLADASSRVGTPLEIPLALCKYAGWAEDGGATRTAAREAAREVVELLLQLGARPLPLPESRPAWYRELVESVREEKGEEEFWEDVKAMEARALPYWRPVEPVE